MLVLMRRKGENVVLDGVGVIKVLHISEGQVRLGFDMGDDVVVFREELAPEGRDFKRSNVARGVTGDAGVEQQLLDARGALEWAHDRIHPRSPAVGAPLTRDGWACGSTCPARKVLQEKVP